MEKEENGNPRLGVQDKRWLFNVLISKVERLFYLNEFPVDLEDFGLSLEDFDVETAWRLLKVKSSDRTLSPVSKIQINIGYDMGKSFHQVMLSTYPKLGAFAQRIFMAPGNKNKKLLEDNRFFKVVNAWGVRQVRLEEQMLRTIKCIKAIVNSCNTVGQYERVSPELIGFLPDKYKIALKDMIKKSPYPAILASPDEIETAMSTLAYAALQPKHHDEEQFIGRISGSHQSAYRLSQFCRSWDYESSDYRRVGI